MNNSQSSQSRYTLLQAILRQLVPNMGTIIIVAAMLFVYNAQASSDISPDALAGPDVIPGVISYQGTLTNASGAPISDSLKITFRIYDDDVSGTVLWQEQQTVTVENGLFHVNLGSVTPFSSGMWSYAQLYLGIRVEGDAEMTPREIINATPLAITVADDSITPSKLSPDVHTVHMLEQPVMVLNNTLAPVPHNPAWINLDLSSYVPATASSVLFDIGAAPAGVGARLSIRVPGSTGQPTPKVETVDSWDFGQGWCNLSNQSVEYQAWGYESDLYFYIQIVGYIE
ncbi:MAG TPA: hypothetical protein PKM21_15850 [Anaerolineales bacterium]|nr:hypothetical protein [Anaerolineales bacterium]